MYFKNTNAGSPIGMNFINVSMFFRTVVIILFIRYYRCYITTCILIVRFSQLFLLLLSNSHVLYWYEPYDVVQFWTLDFFSHDQTRWIEPIRRVHLHHQLMSLFERIALVRMQRAAWGLIELFVNSLRRL